MQNNCILIQDFSRKNKDRVGIWMNTLRFLTMSRFIPCSTYLRLIVSQGITYTPNYSSSGSIIHTLYQTRPQPPFRHLTNHTPQSSKSQRQLANNRLKLSHSLNNTHSKHLVKASNETAFSVRIQLIQCYMSASQKCLHFMSIYRTRSSHNTY